MTDGTELDEIMSEAAASADQPQQTTQETTTTTTTTEQPPVDGQARDDKGRFAGKAEPPESQATQAQPAPEGEKPGTVPQAALHASREREKEARQEAEQLRSQIQQMQGQINLLMQNRTPAAPKEEPKAPDFWENPDEFVNHALTPVQQEMQRQRMETSRMLADAKFGEEVVSAADNALGELARSNPDAAKAVASRMLSARHPFAELVRWHKQNETMRTVGDDPDAYFKSRLDSLLSDPKEAASILERIRGGAAATQPNGQAPVTEVPPTLSRLPGGSGIAAGGMSDEALFSHALAR